MPLVSIICFAYNHENYIKDTLEGFLMQKTNFTFEIIIHDDASNDNTAKIIKEFEKQHPTLIKPIYQKINQARLKRGRVTSIAFKAAKGKYISICEGDDYWINPHKLQQQVDFLENNLDYSICWTKYLIKIESENSNHYHKPDWINEIEENNNLSFDLSTIFTPYCTYTLTVMFRRDSFDFNLFESLKFCKDNSIYAICLTKGKGLLLDITTAVYRMHEGGIYSQVSQFKQALSNYLNFKEIINKIPGCQNQNFSYKRNFFLMKAIELAPSLREKIVWNLLFDVYHFFGWKSALKLGLNKFLK